VNEVNGGVVNHADLFHTGIVVDDLASAKEELGAALGVTWRDGGAEVRLTGATGVRTVQTAYALSTSGPHYVELVQSIPGTVWSVTAPGHAHHLGYWVDDVPSAAAELVRIGSEQVASVAIKDGRPPMCTYHRSRSGLYLEIVDRRMRAVLLPDA
jgi:Glyoxalase/Bleomycin resistance protein/Dioxygenase superfamily